MLNIFINPCNQIKYIYKYRLKRKEKNKSREEIFYQMKVFFVKISCKFV